MTSLRCLVPLLVAVLGIGPGCASLGGGLTREFDGGVRAAADAPGADGPSGPEPDAFFDPTVDAGAAPGLAAEDSCFDFTDDDDDGASDCRDVGCSVTAICCATGSAASSCCVGGSAGDLSPASCAPGSPIGCGSAVGVFGARPPAIVADVARALACGTDRITVLEPGGSEDSDGGIFVGDPVDPTVARVSLSATLGARPGTSSLDAIGVGLTAQADVQGRVLPLVAVLLSSTDAEVRVLVGDIVVASHTLASLVSAATCASELNVTLDVSPDGSFSARVVHPTSGASVELATGVVPAARSARVVVFGRGAAPGAEGPAAWLSSLTIDRQVCSVTDPGRDEAPVLGAGWTISPRSVGRVTVLPEQGLAAVLVDGRVYPGSIDPSGNVVVPDPGVANAIVRPTGAYAGGISDPELVLEGSRLFLLFAGRATATGPDSIYSLAFGSFDLGDVASAAQPILTPEAINAGSASVSAPPLDVLSVDSPAFLTHGGRSYLLVRVRTSEGTELRILERSGSLEAAGVTDTNAPAGVTRGDTPSTTAYRLHANRFDVPSAFDRDEIGAAQVIDLGDGVVRVLYSGRNGTRWAIGMLVSVDLTHFDFAGAGGPPVVSGDGVGFDALSVRDPEPASSPIAPGVSELRLWYSGSDGLRTRVGLASQSIAVVGGTP